MNQVLLSEAKKVYTLAQKAGLVEGISFAEFIPESKLRKISNKLENDKKTFFGANEDLKEAQSLWDLGSGFKIMDALSWYLLEYTEGNKSFAVDWKFAAEDVIYNAQIVLPDLDAEGLGEVEESGIWYEKVKIGGVEHMIKQDEFLIYETVVLINKHISKSGKIFITFRDGDNIHFMLVNEPMALEFEDLNFSLPESY